MTAWRLDYTNALADWDTDGIVGALSDDVTIRVAVHDAPMHGKDMARFLFGVLSEELGPLRPTQEIVEGSHAVVLFETSIDHATAQGLNVIDRDATGLIVELTVFFRPLASLELIAEAVGARMAAHFGPPPE